MWVGMVQCTQSLIQWGRQLGKRLRLVITCWDFFDALDLLHLTCFLLLVLWQEMSSEVVSSNPYSRLMALKRMGIVDNYEDIRKFTVAVVVS